MAHFSTFTVTVMAIFLYPIYKCIYNIWFHPLSKIPGPRLWAASNLPFLSHLLRGTMVHKTEALHRIYGPILRLTPDEVSLAHPDAWTEIVQPRPGRPLILKDPKWWSEPNNRSLLNAIDPTTHARMRRTLAPAFTRTALRAQEPIIQQYVSLLVERLRVLVRSDGKSNDHSITGGALVDIVPWMNFVTFDIFGDLGYGESFHCLEDSKFHPWIAFLFDSVKAITFLCAVKYYPLFDWLLKKCIPPSLKRVQDDHFQHVADKIDRRANWEVFREDVMSHTLKEAKKEGDGMTMDEIYNSFTGITIAGSETSATVLGGILNYLSANRDVREHAVAEVRTVFEKESDITLSGIEERCEYLTAVIREGLRLCPPVPWIPPRRIPLGGETVCGAWLPGGTVVSIQQYALNRNPAFFHDATGFRPERWLPSALNASSLFQNDKLKAVQSFSLGPRSCLGKELAWAELRLILARMLWVFDIEEKEGGSLRWETLRTFILIEKRPLEVKMKERDVKSAE